MSDSSALRALLDLTRLSDGLQGPYSRTLMAGFEGGFGFLVRSQIWVSGAVTSLALAATRELRLTPSLSALCLVFSSTMIIYHVDRLFDVKRRGKVRCVDFHRRWALGAALIWIGALVLATPPARYLVVGGVLLCSLYGIPVSSGRRLKDIPFIKGFWVACGVTVASMVTPWLSSSPSPTSTSWTSFTAVAWSLGFLTWINVHCFDLRDEVEDKLLRSRTLPAHYGRRRTQRWLLGGVLFSISLSLVLLHQGLLSWGFVVGWWGALSLTVLTAFLPPHRGTEFSLRFDLLGDGALYLLAIVLLVWPW